MFVGDSQKFAKTSRNTVCSSPTWKPNTLLHSKHCSAELKGGADTHT